MQLLLPKSLKYLFLAGLLFCLNPVNAQTKYRTLTAQIDSLTQAGLPKSALAVVERLDLLAGKSGDIAGQAQAAFYRVSLQSSLEDNDQATSISSLQLRIAKTNYPLKPILQSLLAQSYWEYYERNRYRISQRSKLLHADPDLANWDNQTIFNQIAHLYELSLADAVKEQNTPVNIIGNALKGDTSTRYLRPALYDLLLHRALDFFLSNEAGITKPRLPFMLNNPAFFGDSKLFANLQILTPDTSSIYYKGLKYLQQATLFHLQKQNKDALADLDLRRLEFLNSYAPLADKDTLYISALHNIALSNSSSPISADALVLLGKYEANRGNTQDALSYFKQALATHPESIGGKNAANYIKEITQTSLTVTVENVEAPGRPLLASITYRNVKAVKMTLYKIWATQYDQMMSMHKDGYTILQPSLEVFDYLKKLKPVKVENIQLPPADDYRQHITEFKIDALNTGIYVMLVHDLASGSDEALQLSSFRISALTSINKRLADGRTQFTVLNRETGLPLPGVQVTTNEINTQTSDTKGNCYFDLSGTYQYAVKLTAANDTLYSPAMYQSGSNSPRTNTYRRVVFFTDREIYRPGQVIYFKGLFIRTEGEKNSLLSGENITYTIRNNNGVLGSATARTNDFGSFAGSFVIPQTVLNGVILISSPYGNKQIRVEEYKRPGFIVKFLPVGTSYKPNDSVRVKGTVTAYSGYRLAQARVAFHVSRSTRVIDYSKFDFRRQHMSYTTDDISTDTLQTDSLGEFEIKFKANITGPDNNNLSYNYSIFADVISGSGETQSANTDVVVALRNIDIHAVVPEKMIAGDSAKITADIQTLGGVKQGGEIKMSIYAVKNPGRIFQNRIWQKPDKYLMSRDDYKNNFPQYAYADEDKRETWPVLNQSSVLSLHTDGKQPATFDIAPLKNQPTGTYKVVMSARNEQGDTISRTYFINLFNKPAQPLGLAFWAISAGKQTPNNRTADFFVGIGQTSNVLMEKYNSGKLVLSQWLHLKGKNQQLIRVPVESGETAQFVQFSAIFQNKMYTARNIVKNLAVDDKNLDIKFLTFRNKLQPGEKEEWKLQISGNDKQEAEMVADLYDASLDAITGNQGSWVNSLFYRRPFTLYNTTWTNLRVYQASSRPYKYIDFYFSPLRRDYEHLFIPTQNVDPNQIFTSVETFGSAKVLPVADPGQINIKGNPNIVIDEPVGNAKKTAGSRFSATVLNELQIVNDYGDQANQAPVGIRRSSAGTAFFYPQLRTDKNGQTLISFTIPQELTTWRFKAFAHTKDLKTGYIERQVITQKELSIIARTPRFLREGDTIIISATLANLTSSPLKGAVELKLYNALNLQPLNWLASPAEARQVFSLPAAANKPVAFKLIVPRGIEALTYRLTAVSGHFSDGEENIIPVLPNRMLITESMPMMVRAMQTKSFTFSKLLNAASPTLKNKTLTLEFTQNPAWYAIQALPYLMEAPYESSEQVFNRYYANAFATDMINKLPAIKKMFNNWSNSSSSELLSNLEKNQELKANLLEETPWLNDALNESERKRRIALLFDLNRMSYELKTNLDKLKARQLPNGGFPWFGGAIAERYITQNILAGMGQLYRLNIVSLTDAEFKGVADKAMTYLDDALSLTAQNQVDFKTRAIAPLEIHNYYAQSYFTARSISPGITDLLNNYLDLAAKQWVRKPLFEQAMIALTMLRNNRPVVAAAIVKSLKETATHSDEQGMYWVQNKAGYYWYQSPIETQCLLIELFTEIGGNEKDVDEMKIWLLRSKQTNNWQTTKATAAACYALLMKGNNILQTNAGTTLKLNGTPLEQLKPEIRADAGIGYIKTTWTDEQIKSTMAKVELKNNSNSISWGALHWQYLENLDKITQAQTNIHLERKYFIEKQTSGGLVLEPVNAVHRPKTGDLLKVVINLNANHDFEYVQLKDMRPAGTEPVDALSAYKYQDGLAYYQITKDVGTNFFISTLNRGNYLFQYELRVVQPGNFSTGITSIQSMYAPEFSAHSAGTRMIIQPR